MSEERKRRDREYQRRRRAAGLAWDQRPENAAKVRERKLRYYHAPYGGWSKRRRRDLAAQRGRIHTELEELRRQTEDLRER